MFDETDELRILRDTVRRAARERIAPLAASIDATGEFNREVEALCWELGLLTLTFPQEHGGAERDQGTALCLAVEEIARHCASSALLLVIQAVGSFPILHGGRPELLDRLLPRMLQNRELAAYLAPRGRGARHPELAPGELGDEHARLRAKVSHGAGEAHEPRVVLQANVLLDVDELDHAARRAPPATRS